MIQFELGLGLGEKARINRALVKGEACPACGRAGGVTIVQSGDLVCRLCGARQFALPLDGKAVAVLAAGPESVPSGRSWVTGDDCVSCGYGRVFFYEERVEGGEHFGALVCGACGAWQDCKCFDYQVPAEVSK